MYLQFHETLFFPMARRLSGPPQEINIPAYVLQAILHHEQGCLQS